MGLFYHLLRKGSPLEPECQGLFPPSARALDFAVFRSHSGFFSTNHLVSGSIIRTINENIHAWTVVLFEKLDFAGLTAGYGASQTVHAGTETGHDSVPS